jgi:hypothetical protein
MVNTLTLQSSEPMSLPNIADWPISNHSLTITSGPHLSLNAVAQPLIKAAAAAIDPNSELRLFNFNWESVKKYLIITIFLLIAIVIKILHANIRLFHAYLPESWLVSHSLYEFSLFIYKILFIMD